MEILNKITVKSVCGNISETAKAMQFDEQRDLCMVIGVVKSSEVVKSQYGESHRLIGEFKAVNLATQEQFFSGSCFLPAIAESLVIGQMDNTIENALQIAFKIGIKKAENKVGYEYTVKPLIKPAENNPLSSLESKIKVEDITYVP